MTDVSSNDPVDLHYEAFPANGTEFVVRPVGFGPGSNNVAVLVEYDPYSEQVHITVGNGPGHDDAPTEIATFLRGMAELLELMGESDEYRAALPAAE